MDKVFGLFSTGLALSVLLAPESVVAVESLVTCSGVGASECNFCTFALMVERILNFITIILILIATIMLAITGIQMAYLAANNQDALGVLKERMLNIVLGFLLIIASWTIIDTVIKLLVTNTTENAAVFTWRDFGRSVGTICGDMTEPVFLHWPGSPEEVDTTIVDVGEVRAPVTGCKGSDCVTLSAACKNSRSCSVSPAIVDNINAFHDAVVGAGVGGVRVTEAMPPTRAHKSSCHQNGTCVDYSRAGGLRPSEVVTVMRIAYEHGLRPVYEVKSNKEKKAIVAAGAPASQVKVLGKWISAPHFSIYGY